MFVFPLDFKFLENRDYVFHFYIFDVYKSAGIQELLNKRLPNWIKNECVTDTFLFIEEETEQV